MRKSVLILLSALLLLSSCGTYTGQGAFVGGEFGSIIGSAIGGISNGRRGSDVGTLIGLAGGAIVGAAIGNAADQAEQRRYEEYRREREERRARINQDRRTDAYDDNDDAATPPEGYFDPTNSGDDRISFDDTPAPTEPATTTTAPTPRAERGIVVRNAIFRDASGDAVLMAGEECTVTFEIMNFSRHEVRNVEPVVYELTGNKHIHISQNLRIESILPGKGIRYTATIKGDSRLRDGEARLRVGVVMGNTELEGQTHEFIIPTKKK